MFVTQNTTFHTSTVATGNKVRNTGESSLWVQNGVATHETTYQIFVADRYNIKLDVLIISLVRCRRAV